MCVVLLDHSLSNAQPLTLSLMLLPLQLGAGFWLTDAAALRTQAEAMARLAYSVSRDPHDCALLYLSLGKRPMLLNLFRTSSNKKVADFLARDFEREEHRRAAAKNAFALLGQHRYSLASAFFILAEQFEDAVGVLAREMGDPQLALLVARLLDAGSASSGSSGVGGLPATVAAGPAAGAATTCPGRLARHVLKEELLPMAESCGEAAAQALVLQLLGDTPAAAARIVGQSNSSSGSSSTGDFNKIQGLPGACSDPLLLSYLLRVLVPQLGGKAVPPGLALKVQQLALRCASAMDAQGLPWMAAEAGAIFLKLHAASSASLTSSGASAAAAATAELASRVAACRLATCLLHHITLDATSLGDSATQVWQSKVLQDLNSLEPLGIVAPQVHVLQLLQSHAFAQGPMFQSLLANLSACAELARRPTCSTSQTLDGAPAAGGRPQPLAVDSRADFASNYLVGPSSPTSPSDAGLRATLRRVSAPPSPDGNGATHAISTFFSGLLGSGVAAAAAGPSPGKMQSPKASSPNGRTAPTGAAGSHSGDDGNAPAIMQDSAASRRPSLEAAAAAGGGAAVPEPSQRHTGVVTEAIVLSVVDGDKCRSVACSFGCRVGVPGAQSVLSQPLAVATSRHGLMQAAMSLQLSSSSTGMTHAGSASSKRAVVAGAALDRHTL